MIHCQGGIEAAVVSKAEETIRGIWTESLDTLGLGFLYGGEDDVLLFVAKQAAVAAVGVKAKHGNLGIQHSEVALQ